MYKNKHVNPLFIFIHSLVIQLTFSHKCSFVLTCIVMESHQILQTYKE